MKRMQAFSVLGMGCALALLAGCGGQQPFKLHFPDGVERTCEVWESTETEISIPVINEGMRQANRTDATLGIAVAEPSADGPAKMAVTLEDAGGSMSMSFMCDTMKFEGDGDDNPMAPFDKVLASQGVGALSPWTVTYTMTYSLPMAIEDTCTVLNVYDDRVTIDVASVLTPHPTESSIDFGAQCSMNLDVNSTGEGFIEVERATEWINEASTTMRIRGDAELQGMPVQMPPGMDKRPLTARVLFDSKAI